MYQCYLLKFLEGTLQTFGGHHQQPSILVEQLFAHLIHKLEHDLKCVEFIVEQTAVNWITRHVVDYHVARDLLEGEKKPGKMETGSALP